MPAFPALRVCRTKYNGTRGDHSQTSPFSSIVFSTFLSWNTTSSISSPVIGLTKYPFTLLAFRPLAVHGRCGPAVYDHGHILVLVSHESQHLLAVLLRQVQVQKHQVRHFPVTSMHLLKRNRWPPRRPAAWSPGQSSRCRLGCTPDMHLAGLSPISNTSICSSMFTQRPQVDIIPASADEATCSGTGVVPPVYSVRSADRPLFRIPRSRNP